MPKDKTENLTPKDRSTTTMGKGVVTVTLMVMRDLRQGDETARPLGQANAAVAVAEFALPTDRLTPEEVGTLIGLRARHYVSYAEDGLDQMQTEVEADGATEGAEAGEAAATQRDPHQDFQA
jgi:hypothetical protein